MHQPLSLFDDLASADGDAQQSPGGWASVRARLDSDGIALTPPLLSEAECREARAWFDDPGRFRSTVVMQRHGFGRGTYRYPEVVSALVAAADHQEASSTPPSPRQLQPPARKP
jgi:hypothetical protein